jgi:hypothetical protein
MTPEQELGLITDRLKIARKGIILRKPRPCCRPFCATSDYRVVHMVPASPGTQSRNQLEKSYNSDNLGFAHVSADTYLHVNRNADGVS